MLKSGVDEKLDTVLSFTSQDLRERDEVLATIISPHTGKPFNITGDVDDAMKYALDNEGLIEYDAERDKKLLRKIDLYMMPIMCLLYCLQFMDKLSNSYASIVGLRTDLHMKGDMYSWTGSAFYIGYLFFEFPAVRILQRFPVAKTVGVFVITWGVILSLHSVPQYAGFIALRTILGMLELSITPAFVIITGQYYRKEETFLRTALWFSSNGIGQILGSGAIAYNVVNNAGSYSITAWKLIFIITGCLTIFIGFVILAHVPDTPSKAWFLNAEDKRLVIERIRVNQQGFGNKHFKKEQFIEAFTDIKTWLFFLFAITNNVPNGGLTNFGAILLSEGFGYSKKQSLLMQMPFGAIEFVGCTLFACCYKFYPIRLAWAILATVVTVVGQCLLGFVDNHNAQFAGYCLNALAPLGFICILSSIASNVAGHTKKTTVSAIFLIGYCVGNLVGPQTFIDLEAPQYTTAKVCMLTFSLVSLVCLVLILLYYTYENKRRDNAEADNAEFMNIENIEFADLTDKQNPFFRYTA
ncbi:allantoate permease [Suhomyces tanzawaensis NRRL Y-17324]|uniref:Allantoate permease n=1 Tax=Suhomyces tanzawaensis NRRL Y-17324 TaxID=984487 RepID=A0A1E4SB34_9ASCO|nr:allantoate permease [Suhomyces tanzawaensis NRRL Y-17324]ODV76719.1 allantoate permease [Suhomyces tanzawaensis NRRL Y-17324]